mmetsp:Transcript_4281/g.17368  ORF Transcript_4281/g.17368 Transcript_4281/m.17368 type:complete len:505 (-) Transcript_4281:362-1876(-)
MMPRPPRPSGDGLRRSSWSWTTVSTTPLQEQTSHHTWGRRRRRRRPAPTVSASSTPGRGSLCISFMRDWLVHARTLVYGAPTTTTPSRSRHSASPPSPAFGPEEARRGAGHADVGRGLGARLEVAEGAREGPSAAVGEAVAGLATVGRRGARGDAEVALGFEEVDAGADLVRGARGGAAPRTLAGSSAFIGALTVVLLVVVLGQLGEAVVLVDDRDGRAVARAADHEIVARRADFGDLGLQVGDHGAFLRHGHRAVDATVVHEHVVHALVDAVALARCELGVRHDGGHLPRVLESEIEVGDRDARAQDGLRRQLLELGGAEAVLHPAAVPAALPDRARLDAVERQEHGRPPRLRGRRPAEHVHERVALERRVSDVGEQHGLVLGFVVVFLEVARYERPAQRRRVILAQVGGLERVDVVGLDIDSVLCGDGPKVVVDRRAVDEQYARRLRRVTPQRRGEHGEIRHGDLLRESDHEVSRCHRLLLLLPSSDSVVDRRGRARHRHRL